MKKGRKALSILLLVCVCITSCFGYAPISASAAELPAPVLSYLAGTEQVVTNGTNYYAVTSSEDVNRIKNLTDFTICMEYKTTSSGLQSLFFADGNGATTNQHFNLYIYPQNVTATGSTTKVGIEIRDGSKNPGLYSTVDVHSLDGNWHKIAMTYKSGTGYEVYLDNIKVGSFTGSDYNTRFLNSLGVATDNMSFGSGTRVSGNNYPFTGSIRNINMYDQVLSSSDLEEFMTAGITIDSTTALFTSAGEKKQLQATVKPAGTAVTWASSDPSVATVSDTGLVTAVASGNATITATSADGSSAVCAVKVAILATALEKRDLHLDGTSATVVDLSAEAGSVKLLEKGTITARYRSDSDMTNTSANLMTLFSISDKNASDTYMNFFVSPAGNSVGYELKKNGTGVSNVKVSTGLNLTNTKWHTVSYVFDKANSIFVIYVDGKVIKSENAQKDFLSALSAEGNCVRIGDMSRAIKGDHLWPFKGDIEFLQVSGDVCTAEQIAGIHEATVDKTVTVVPEIADRAADVDLYTPGVGSVAYRIPSLLTTKKGTVLAVADRRNSGWGDSGDISFAVRRSTDSGKTWSPMQIVYDPPADTTPGSGGNSLLIDAVMVQDQTTEDIYCMMDFFPESSALMGPTETNSGYTQVGDKRYLTLKFGDGTIAGSTGSYVLGDDKAVYLLESDGTTLTKSEYTVPDFKTGKILKNGADAGNIFLYGETSDSLNIIKTNYLWMFKSSDEGQTWSDPVDVSKYLKKDWMKFLGTGPGVGMQIENGEHAGRLVIPVYMANSNLGASQSSAVMYSDDHGVNWTLGESANDGRNGIVTETMTGGGLLTESQVVEVGNSGVLKMFCRNSGVGGGKVVICTSTDGGATWNNTVQTDPALTEVYCQLSVIKWPEKIDGKTAYVFANPTVTDRMNGKVRIGFYDEATDKFTWPYEQLIVNGKYAYSCLTALPNGRIGLLYEGEAANGQWHRIMFADFNVEWVTAQREYVEPKPSITNVEAAEADGKLTFNVTFDQAMMSMKAPVLKFQLNGVNKTAAFVSSVNYGKEYVFEYALEGTETGTIVVTNVAANPDQAASSIGNYANQMPADVAEMFDLEGTEVPADEAMVGSFVTRLYEKVLSRTATESELAYYTNALLSDASESTYMTGAKAAYSLLVSPEFKNRNLSNSDYMDVLYTIFMGCSSDAAGKAYWMNYLDYGVSREFALKGFAESAEFQGICDYYGIERGTIVLTEARDQDPSLTMFVDRLYSKIMGKAAEADTLNYYANEILGGRMEPAYVAKNLIFSTEFENRQLSDTEYIKVLYRTFIGREADADGLSYHLERMKSGTSRKELFYGFVNTPEFADIMREFGLEFAPITDSPDPVPGSEYPDFTIESGVLTGYKGTGGTVVIPESLGITSIGSNAFRNCVTLTSITIPSSVTSLGANAFSNCSALTDVYFYGNAPSMGSGVFDYTADDLSIYYYYNVSGFTDTWYGYETIGFMVFDSEAVSAFITRLYEKVLSRTPDASEIEYYMNQLSYEDFEDPAMTGADVGRGFVFSQESKNRNLSNSDFLEVLYTTFMNRPSDAGGKAYWLNMLDNSVSREFVFKSFVESDEYVDVCNSCGIVSGEVVLPDARDQNPNLTMFVSRLYSKALGRAAETDGLNYYAAEILSGRIAPEDAAQNFIFSPEFEDKNLSDTEYVKVLYRTFMGREFDEGGLSYHLNRMGNGVSREEILFGFAYSPEFEEIMSSFGL